MMGARWVPGLALALEPLKGPPQGYSVDLWLREGQKSTEGWLQQPALPLCPAGETIPNPAPLILHPVPCITPGPRAVRSQSVNWVVLGAGSPRQRRTVSGGLVAETSGLRGGRRFWGQALGLRAAGPGAQGCGWGGRGYGLQQWPSWAFPACSGPIALLTSRQRPGLVLARPQVPDSTGDSQSRQAQGPCRGWPRPSPQTGLP